MYQSATAGHPFRVPLWLAVPQAVGAGALLDASFPDRGWWALAPLAVAILITSLVGRNLGTSVLIGVAAGGTFWLLHVEWLTLYLGPVPWLALATLETIFFTIGTAAISVVLNRSTGIWPSRLCQIGLVPLLIAGIWTAREGVAAVWPYGGFAWGRLAISQVDGAFADLLPWFGAAGVSFLVAWLGAITIQSIRFGVGNLASRAVVPVAAVVILVAIPAWPASTGGTFRIGAVQGGADAGLFADYQPGELLEAHASESHDLSEENLDAVIWPENSTDVDPTRSVAAAATLDQLASTFDAPLVVGTITNRDDKYFNSSLLWEAGAGVTDWYDKAHPVPFAEYMPDRAFWRSFAPDLVDLVTRDYTIGTRENVFDLDAVTAGVAICFDIADDQLIRNMMGSGAQLILAQTNNADFGRTDESVQQLAIAKMRALETSRTVVNISTVGTSAIILPDGSTVAQLPTWEPGTMIAEVPLVSETTPAIAAGRQVEWFLITVGLAGILVTTSHPTSPTRTRIGAASPSTLTGLRSGSGIFGVFRAR